MYKTIVGLEVHMELDTKSKMFCNCANDTDEHHANRNICPVCTAQPGSLPVINRGAVKKTIKTALALNCQVSRESWFERKNYFYPDLPKGYQISQYKAPLAKKGFLEINQKKIRIERVHLEEDTGRLIHSKDKSSSLVDFNRAGVPLMELVTEADIESAQQARDFIKELQLILRYLQVSRANMEKGEMRVEVNISLAKPGVKKLGTKVEVKNLNSIAVVAKAIEYEIKRQTGLLRKGKEISQETRGWHDKKQTTFSQRKKEESHDYRYFPEPDLPPLKINAGFLQEVRAELTELPSQKRERLEREYGLSFQEAEMFIFQADLGEYFEKVMSELKVWAKQKKQKALSGAELEKLTKLAVNYISTDLQALLKGSSFKEERFLVTPENFAEFLSMIQSNEISSKIAKMVLKEMFEHGGDPSQIIEEKGLKQITDTKDIKKVVKEIIKENPKPVGDYKKGKGSALQFLIGKVMAQTKGRANPASVSQLLEKFLSK